MSSDAVAVTVAAMVKTGQVDFGISSQTYGDRELSSHLLMMDRLCAVVAPGHPLARKRSLAAQRRASRHQAHGCCLRACAARRQFSNTLNSGKIVVRYHPPIDVAAGSGGGPGCLGGGASCGLRACGRSVEGKMLKV